MMYYINGIILFYARFLKDEDFVRQIFYAINPNDSAENIIAEIKQKCSNAKCLCEVRKIRGVPPIVSNKITETLDLYRKGKIENAIRHGKGFVDIDTENGKIIVHLNDSWFMMSPENIDTLRYTSEKKIFAEVYKHVNKDEVKRIEYCDPYVYVYDEDNCARRFMYNPIKQTVKEMR